MITKNLLTTALVTSLMIGCAENSSFVSPTNTAVEPQSEPQKSARNDLPLNWFEVKGEGWSYGLPVSFSATNPLPRGMLANHKSLNHKLTVSFQTHINPKDNTSDYVVDNFAAPYMASGKEILALMQNNKKSPPIIALHVLDAPNAQGMRDASLHFFVQKDHTVYHMVCSSEALNLKTKANMCFDIIESLSIK